MVYFYIAHEGSGLSVSTGLGTFEGWACVSGIVYDARGKDYCDDLILWMLFCSKKFYSESNFFLWVQK